MRAMFARLWNLPFLALAIVACTVTTAAAQLDANPRPVSSTSGFAGTELRNIYRDSIGTGYSVSTLNQQSLARGSAKVPNVGQSTFRAGRIDPGLPSARNASKPFSNFSPAPTVSPYLNLFREDLDGSSDLNYNTLVRPMLQQQQLNQQLQRQGMELARRLQYISAQSDFNPAGSTQQPPTGHQTVFGYHSHFYPSMQRGR